MQAEGLKEQLVKRPPAEHVEELNRELREQEIILQGTMMEGGSQVVKRSRVSAHTIKSRGTYGPTFAPHS